MRINTRTVVLATLLGFALPALATTVQRCEDDQGNITFTSLGCPSDHHTQSYETYNAPPRGTAPLLPEYQPPAHSSADRQNTHKELVIVGQRDEVCGNLLSDKQRRQAIIKQQIRLGMTLRDVESALGKPDKIVKRNAETRYSYTEKKGGSQQVIFDENECVKKGKR
ncbi:MAG: cell envelope protein SmpA [Pseudomonas sp.]